MNPPPIPLAPDDEPGTDDALGQAREVFLRAILGGRRKEALQVALEAMRAGVSLPDIYIAIFQESLYRVGRLWETNRITVAEEHMATAITQAVIAHVYQSLEPAPVTRGRALVTGVQGELHQVGANMVADVLEADGWSVRFLGTNMPHEGIVQAVAELDADLVGISATMLFNVAAVVRLMDDIRRARAARPPRILVGGAAFRASPGLWEQIGADASARDLGELRQLLGSPVA